VKPAGSFELDYWGTSFREVAERLNDYARKTTTRGEKLRLLVCGPSKTLTPFLDPDMFEVLPFRSSVDPNEFAVLRRDAAPQLIVALNRFRCMAFVNGPWLISIKRGDLVFAVVARS
jgi:hypothetical protein